MNISRSTRTTALAVAMLVAVSVAALSILAPPQARPTEAQGEEPLDIALPSVTYHSHGLLKTEESAVLWSEGIFRGEVISVTTSAYNTFDGQYSPAVEVWDGDELLSDFTPERYYTVTFAVDEWWKNPDNFSSPVSIIVNGYSPVDSAPVQAMPDELLYEGDYGHTWEIGDEVVAMVVSESFLGRTVYQTALQMVYFIEPGASLVNVVSPYITRSDTVSKLQKVVEDNS